MNRISIHIALAAILSVALSSCRNKELCYDPHDGPRADMNIVIHWPEGVAKPGKGMMVNLFGADGSTPDYGMASYPADGGPVRLFGGGVYDGLCYDYYAGNVYFRGEDAYDGAEAYCAPLVRATYSRAFPDENTVSEPANPFWVDHTDDFTVDGSDMHFYPRNVVEVFTFEIRDIEGARYITSCRGGIGGMAGSHFMADGTLGNEVTVLFDAQQDGLNDKITGSFRTFGSLRTSGNVNAFTIEILYPSEEGGIINGRWDVTDQVLAAQHIPGTPDIIIDNGGVVPPIDEVENPDPGPGSGFDADVEDWEDVRVPLPM
jgi:hypothetical protein